MTLSPLWGLHVTGEHPWQGRCSSQERELRDRDSDRASGRAGATRGHSCPLRSLLTPEPFRGDQLKDTERCPNPPSTAQGHR